MTNELTGRHVLMIFCFAFSIIIAVNLTLATKAVQTFPGLEVKNSYVASQSFDRERAAQTALGWSVSARAEGQVFTLAITDATGAVLPRIDKAILGRATHVGEDQILTLAANGDVLTAPIIPLARGLWQLRVEARADDGTLFKQILDVEVAR